MPIRLSADFSTETLQARREWHDILKGTKGKNRQPRILYPARLPFKSDGEIKSFPDKQKLREFSATKPALVVAQTVKCLPTMWETWVLSLGWEDSMEKEMATHFSTSCLENPMDGGAWCRLPSMGS